MTFKRYLHAVILGFVLLFMYDALSKPVTVKPHKGLFLGISKLAVYEGRR
jgi:hypothetical protein